MHLLQFNHSNRTRSTSPNVSSQQRQPSRSHRQRRPNDLSPRCLRGRRPRRVLGDNTRLRNAHARQVVLIRCGYSAVPARRSRTGYDGIEVVGWVGFDFLEDGLRDGGFEGVEDGGVFGLGGQGGEVGFEVVEDVGGLERGGLAGER